MDSINVDDIFGHESEEDEEIIAGEPVRDDNEQEFSEPNDEIEDVENSEDEEESVRNDPQEVSDTYDEIDDVDNSEDEEEPVRNDPQEVSDTYDEIDDVDNSEDEEEPVRNDPQEVSESNDEMNISDDEEVVILSCGKKILLINYKNKDAQQIILRKKYQKEIPGKKWREFIENIDGHDAFISKESGTSSSTNTVKYAKTSVLSTPGLENSPTPALSNVEKGQGTASSNVTSGHNKEGKGKKK
ncbi:hypothetical protein HK096_006011, partial [Nowakowskiella sp. JEL0078]